MVNNGSLHYDHDRDGTHTELAGCVSSFRKIEREAYLAVRYEMNKLTVIFSDIYLLVAQEIKPMDDFSWLESLSVGSGLKYMGFSKNSPTQWGFLVLSSTGFYCFL